MAKRNLNIVPLKKTKKSKVAQTERKGSEVLEKTSTFIPIFLPQFLLFIAVLIAFPQNNRFDWGDLETGTLWRQKDVVAPYDFPILKTPTELNQEKALVDAQIQPVFELKPTDSISFGSNLNALQTNLKELEAAYQQINKDSTQFTRLKKQFPVNLSNAEWKKLFSKSATNDITYLTLLDWFGEIYPTLSTDNLVDVPREGIKSTEIAIYNPQNNFETLFPTNKLRYLSEIEGQIQTKLKSYTPDETLQKIGGALMRMCMVTSLNYDAKTTDQRHKDALESIASSRGMVRTGQVIVLKGDRITPEVKQQLHSLVQASQHQGQFPWWRVKLGELILTLCVLTILFLFLFVLRRNIFTNVKHIWLICTLLMLDVVFFGFAARYNLPYLLLPVTLSSILFTLAFDSRVGFYGTISVALLGGLIFGYDFKLAFLTIFSGLVSVFSVRVVQNRLQFFITPAWVLLALSIGWTGISLVESAEWNSYLMGMLYILLNSIFILLVYPLTGVMERFFDITTELTLLELSDTNRPLLKSLSQNAPGTFNHSLQVANMVEAATQAVGGNALLARVGALYHDIGKMAKPEFFIENQRGGENPLDALTPRMGARVIANHVKEGLEIAEEHRLPNVIRDFIPTHHGTMRIEYFYRKAIAQQNPHESSISESDFRYPGPKPTTVETGILMLADGIEAACKSMEKPTFRRIEGVVDKMIQARIQDGQLSECPLNFQDITRIKNAFLNVLAGIYHVRIKYPGQDDDPITLSEPVQDPDSAEPKTIEKLMD